ncbi:SRPBCC domain-containing protein [Pelagibius sp. Alg239-R121]|uniref:SRPBCC family protein n=1 Tax=Pelagibius sp. Alg239-R121 TaxID=2993448 RepID=UPI0024A6556B|nr:SRPBCC domain-containing protein [Pelagibius sp. Alg239-R121]
MENPASDALAPAPDMRNEDRVLRLSRIFDATRETLFEAFTDPAVLVRWWGPEGVTIPECRIDLRVGGSWRTCMQGANCEHNCVGGVYKEIVPPEKLAFTWAWDTPDGPGPETLITLEFLERDDGCELSFTQEGFADTAVRDQHRQGWSSSFNCLRDLFAGDSGR